VISSSANATIKAIRHLRQRKSREESGTFYIEGIRLVGQAVDSGAFIETCVVAPGLLSSEYASGLVDQLRDSGAEVLEVTPEVFRGLAMKDNPQGIGAVVHQRWSDLGDITEMLGLGWVALDEIADPGNLGTILRTCDAVGCEGVLLLGDTTDPHDPSAVRASMGAVFSQRLARAAFDDFAAWRKEFAHPLVGTSDQAEQPYRAVSYPTPLVLLMGSERHGLTDAQRAICDAVVRIPMTGTADSLNLAVAMGVVLYEVYHQHQNR
jgi:TrmH family RNA methyltransferase